MKHLFLTFFILFGWFLAGFAQVDVSVSKVDPSVREHILMDLNWRFALGHASDVAKDFSNGTSYFSWFAKTGYGDGAAAPQFEDRTWREVNLPHDWAVELPFSAASSHSSLLSMR